MIPTWQLRKLRGEEARQSHGTREWNSWAQAPLRRFPGCELCHVVFLQVLACIFVFALTKGTEP